MVNDLHDRKFSKEELDRMKEGFEEFFKLGLLRKNVNLMIMF